MEREIHSVSPLHNLGTVVLGLVTSHLKLSGDICDTDS